MGKRISADFYQQDDVCSIAKELIGKLLLTHIEGHYCIGRIVETEAYAGRDDKACHANAKRTARTEIMYAAGGVAYVYLCYGIHHLFNLVTNTEGMADAVLIRAIAPLEGIACMQQRRQTAKLHNLASGPGKLSQAFGIHTGHYGQSLQGPHIWLEDDGYEVSKAEIVASTRIGVAYAGEDALKPWRYYLKDSLHVSVR